VIDRPTSVGERPLSKVSAVDALQDIRTNRKTGMTPAEARAGLVMMLALISWLMTHPEAGHHHSAQVVVSPW
jgi:hypothetical protein